MRDNFTRNTSITLAKRVGWLCSNPNCSVPTVGPNSDTTKSTNIGVACHITAASTGGPRFDPALDSKARGSIENGIWLCQTCSKLVDSDVIKYRVDILKRWKDLAERNAEISISKGIISRDYSKIFNLMPELILEMKKDIHENPLAREFVLFKKNWTYNNPHGTILFYFYDDHTELDNKIRLLERNGLVEEITYNNTDRFLFNEEFVEILIHLNV
jgi:hypothetical protein